MFEATTNTNNSVNSYSSLMGSARSTETPNFEALRTAFAESMRFSLTGRTPQNESYGIETPDSAQKNADRKLDQQQSTQRRDFSKEDKRTLNNSEIRRSDIDNDYVRNIDRHESRQMEYREKIEHREPTSLNSVLPDVPDFSTLSPDTASSITESIAASTVIPIFSEQFALPMTEPIAMQKSAPQAPVIIPASFHAVNSQPMPFIMPAVTASLPSVTAPQTASVTPINVLTAASVMTIFTATGRFGKIKDENEERSAASEKKKEKKNAVSLFGQAVSEIVQNLPKMVETELEAESEPFEKSAVSVRESDEQRGEEGNEDSNEKPKETASGGISLKDILKEEKPKEEPDEAVLALLRRMENNFVPKKEPIKTEEKPFDRFQFFQRVADACQSAANQNGTVRFKLNLDQLGLLTLKITTKSNRLSVRFETTTNTAARKILDNINELKSSLAEQNIVLETVDVSVNEPES